MLDIFKGIITFKYLWHNVSTVKPVYNDHTRDPKIVAIVDRWSLFRGHFVTKYQIGTYKLLPLLTGGRYLEVVVNSGLTVLQIVANSLKVNYVVYLSFGLYDILWNLWNFLDVQYQW